MTKKGKKNQSFKLNGYFVVFHKTRFRHFTQKQSKDFPLHYKNSLFFVPRSSFLIRRSSFVVRRSSFPIPPFPVPPFKIARGAHDISGNMTGLHPYF